MEHHPEIAIFSDYRSVDSKNEIDESIDMILDPPEFRNFKRNIFFGALDILMCFSRYPILNVGICIEKLEIHPVDSNPYAFRFAARDAARKALESSGFFLWDKVVIRLDES